jgi:hypothetical protein
VGRVLQSIVVGVLLATAIASLSRADGAREDEQLNAAVAVENYRGDFRALEKLVLQTTHARAYREDGRLTLLLGDDHELTFQDQEGPGVARGLVIVYLSYYLLADLPSRHAFVVLETHPYSGGRPYVWLIDDREGRQTRLPAVPQFGPESREFITLDNRFSNDTPDITVWQWREGTAQAVWHHGFELDPIYHTTALIRWADPDAIYLDLWCASGPHWPAVVRRGLEGWRLETKWPKFEARACGNPNPD